MSFHEVRFPTAISFGARGGPMRKTVVVEAVSGAEERNSLWANSRRKWDAGYGVKSLDDLNAVIEFFEERRGRLHGFRWRDRTDWKSCAPLQTPAFDDQQIGIGDGVTTTFQLIKTYGSVHAPWARTIAKPVSGTVLIGIGGVNQASGWTVSSATGIVTFSVAPSSLAVVTAGYEFDVPVRFDTDFLDIDEINFGAGRAASIMIKEIRV